LIPILSERSSEREIGINNDGESGRKGLFSGMVYPYFWLVNIKLLPTF